jgi:hypothetical protein
MRLVTVLALITLLPAQTPQSPIAPQLRPLFTGVDAATRFEQPQLAVRADGALALVFVAGGTSIRLSLRPPGKEWQAPVIVADLPNLAAGMHRGPRVAFAGDALVVACIESHWDNKTKSMSGSGNLTVRRSTDNGAHWSAAVKVNGEDGSAQEGLHALAARGDRVALVWNDPRGDSKRMRVWCAESDDGGVTFGKDFVAYANKSGPICPCCHPSLCIDAKGRPVVMWRDALDGNRDFYIGVIESAGKAVATPVAAGEGHWQIAACPMDGGGLALAAEDRAISAWRRGDEIYWAYAGAEHRLGAGRNPTIAGSGTTALAVWEASGLIATALVDAAKPEGKPLARVLGAGVFPAVAALPGGHFVVAAEVMVGDRARIAVCDQ